VNPKAIGEKSEAIIMAALLRHGFVVLTPFGDNQRYDLVIDLDGVFLRVQCKTGRLSRGAVVFNTCSSQAHRGGGHQSYAGQVELFGVYSPDLDKVFFVPVGEVGGRQGNLRVEPAKSNQAKGTRSAAAFEFTGNLAPFVSDRVAGASVAP
jgi:hypothetical protein